MGNACPVILISGENPERLVQALSASTDSLRIDIGPDSVPAHPEQWIPRFEHLSDDLLKNFLNADGYALRLAKTIDPVWIPRLIALAQRHFSRVLISALYEPAEPFWNCLDSAGLLLWFLKPTATAESFLQKAMNDLAARHYPNQLSQVVLEGSVPVAAFGTRPVIGTLPAQDGIAYRQAISSLLLRLQDLSLYPRASALNTADAVETLKRRVQPQLAQQVSSQDKQKTHQAAEETIQACLAEETTLPASRTERGEIFKRVLEEVLGLGPLEPFLKDDSVTEIMVNGRGAFFVEKGGRLHAVGGSFASEEQLRTVIDRIVAPLGRRVDESSPLCDARLADGSRVNIVLPPLALDGAALTIRKFPKRTLNMDDLVQKGSLSPGMAVFLKQCVVGRRNIVVAGGTGSGKTTLLNALSSLIPDDERIVTIEDAAELRLMKPHVVRLESRAPNAEGEGAVPIRRLVINALRMRPDRIVVGECRGGEALDMLQAMNTGHDGSLTTLHANTPRDALGRLETLVLMAGMDLPVKVVREQIRSAVHLIVQQTRLGNGSRKITSITELTGMEGDILTTQEIFRFRADCFEATGLRPKFGETT